MTNSVFNFNSFNGSDVSIFLLFNKAQASGIQTIQVGNISALKGVIQVEAAPRYVMGEADPQGLSTGKRLIQGSLTIESLNRAFITELAEILDEEFLKTYRVADSDATTVSSLKLKYADQLPEFDIRIICVKEENPNQKAYRDIIGCKIFSESSGIGLSTLDIQENYGFMAREITPMRKL